MRIAMSNTVQCENVSVVLNGVSILKDVSATVPVGGSTAIIGPNGAGKTTLIKAILGDIHYSGSITFSHTEKAKPRIGYVPQRLHFDRGIPLQVIEFMVMGIQRRPLWLGIKPAAKEVAFELLKSVKAEHLMNRNIGALSGGEMQRVLLALALQQDPELLLLDEPAAGVDPHGELLFCEILETQRSVRNYTQLMVSHDLGTVSNHATHVICLNKSVAAEGAPEQVLTQEVLSTIFGAHMGLVNADMVKDGMVHSHDCSTHGGSS